MLGHYHGHAAMLMLPRYFSRLLPLFLMPCCRCFDIAAFILRFRAFLRYMLMPTLLRRDVYVDAFFVTLIAHAEAITMPLLRQRFMLPFSIAYHPLTPDVTYSLRHTPLVVSPPCLSTRQYITKIRHLLRLMTARC